MLLFLQENGKMSLHQKVDKLEREICELNAMIKEILKYKGTQCCDGGESGNHDVYFKDVLETPTTLSGYGITDAIPTSHVSYRITRDLISNWNKAYSLSHSHDNKRILDETTSSFTTELKTKLDNLSNYTLPKATNQRLGGIILGEGLASDENGVVRVTVTGGGNNVEYVLPKASGSVLGGIKVGRNLTIDSDGALHASDPVLGNEYVLPIANSTTLGGFKVGNNLAMTSDGVLNAINTTYDQGSGIKITGTTISVDYSILHEHSNKSILDETTASYTQEEKSKLQTLENFILGKATTTTLGGVIIGSGINVTDGVISVDLNADNIYNSDGTLEENRNVDLNGFSLNLNNGLVKANKYSYNIITDNSTPNTIWVDGTDAWYTNDSGVSKKIGQDEPQINMTITSNTNISASMNGKNVVFDNGELNLSLLVASSLPENFLMTGIKEGTGRLTIVGQAGVTIRLVTYSDVVNGAKGSRFMLSRVGSTNIFNLYVANYD